MFIKNRVSEDITFESSDNNAAGVVKAGGIGTLGVGGVLACVNAFADAPVAMTALVLSGSAMAAAGACLGGNDTQTSESGKPSA